MSNHAGLPVHGYRPQTDDKISYVNANKELEEVVLRMIDQLMNDEPGFDADKRWLSIGRTHIEQGFMAINRAVFKPTRVALPDPTDT